MKHFILAPMRELSDGLIVAMHPFHISFEGAESIILCRCDADYDVFVKTIAICARRNDVVVVTYAVVSNHAHCVVLAMDYANAKAFAEAIKKHYSMYFRKQYGIASSMRGINAQAVEIDSPRYLRNALAYDIRNAMDNGAISISDYKWTGFRAYFRGGMIPVSTRCVKEFSRRETMRVMRTHDYLSDVRWQVNERDELEPASFCDWKYLESAFLDDHAFFLKTIGQVNIYEMEEKMVLSQKQMVRDEDFLRLADETSMAWFNVKVHDLSREKKIRLMTYLRRIHKTSIPQLSRIFEMSREEVERVTEN